MLELTVTLFATVFVIGTSAMSVPGATCDVGEQEAVGGLCDNNDKCNNYCKSKFGDEFVGAACSDPRPNGQRECICKLKCCNQGCWGDPHCWTCDGVRFGYQGLKKYFVLKPVTAYKTLPYFDIRQINRVWQQGPMAILDISEVVIKDWGLVVELKVPDAAKNEYVLKVNEQVHQIPYRYTDLDGHVENFVNIVYGNKEKTQVVLTTSFGLRIVYTTNGAGTNLYSDMSIDTPRHPELKNQIHGLLGRWNGNPDDDSVDATGKKQPLDDAFSWAFGDSWIVPGGRTKTADCVRDDAVKVHQDKIQNADAKAKEAAEKDCTGALESPALKDCAQKLGRAVPLIKNCIVDLVTIENPQARKDYLANLVSSFAHTCERRGHGFGKGSNEGNKQRLVLEPPKPTSRPVPPPQPKPVPVPPQPQPQPKPTAAPTAKPPAARRTTIQPRYSEGSGEAVAFAL